VCFYCGNMLCCGGMRGTPRGPLHRQLATGAPNDVVRRSGFHELEAIAEGDSVSHQRENLYLSKGQLEL
jgi:hypothetical protein